MGEKCGGQMRPLGQVKARGKGVAGMALKGKALGGHGGSFVDVRPNWRLARRRARHVTTASREGER